MEYKGLYRLFHTISFLKIRQLAYQIYYRIVKLKYRHLSRKRKNEDNIRLGVFPIHRVCCYQGQDEFSFLNLKDCFVFWDSIANGMLWAYNLNYMDWLQQKGLSVAEGERWIERFIQDLPQNRVGLDPYPIALRGINWIKFITIHNREIGSDKLDRWNDSLYSQYVLLTKKLEYHLLGNHLLEDAYSLFIAAIYFNDRTFYKKATTLLRQELAEQILPDGAHFEQSPMYHCILLDRLLDCCNFSFNNIRFENQGFFNDYLRQKAVLMLGHLESIRYANGDIPLLNDSARGIAPLPSQLFDYAQRLGLHWDLIPMRECGYRKLQGKDVEAIVDVGNITASYQPGHSHADTFSYELRLGGLPFVVDTGISTYNKTARRQYERSTIAHNTVSFDKKDSSEVWGGFRVGHRAFVKLLKDEPCLVKASHDGFGLSHIHTRTFEIEKRGFVITDEISTTEDAVSYIHLALDVDILEVNTCQVKTNRGMIMIEGAEEIEITENQISVSYNQFQLSQTIKIYFSKILRYSISYQ